MDKVKKSLKKRPLWLETPIILLLSFIMIIAGSITGLFIVAVLPISPTDAWITAKLYMTFLGIWLFTLFCILITRRNRPILRTLWTEARGNSLKYLLSGLGIGAVFNCLCILGAWLNGDLSFYFGSFHPVSFVLVFIAVFIQSSAEELVCRVFLYQRLLGSTGKVWVAVIANSAFFSLLHVGNNGVTCLALADIALIGIFLSLMVYYTDSVWCAFAFHAAWNFNQNIMFGLPNSGNVLPYSVIKPDAASARDSFFYNVGFGVEGTWFSVLLYIAAIIALILWGRKHGRQPINVWQDGYPPLQSSGQKPCTDINDY